MHYWTHINERCKIDTFILMWKIQATSTKIPRNECFSGLYILAEKKKNLFSV